MEVCLVRKLANCIDGIDIARYRVGDVVDLPAAAAQLLIAEGWAVRERRRAVSRIAGKDRRHVYPRESVRSRAADARRRTASKRSGGPQE